MIHAGYRHISLITRSLVRHSCRTAQRLTVANDNRGNSLLYTLDGLRRPTVTTFADNTAASQAWNALDQLTQATDPKGVATQYTRNAFGEVLSETSPDTGTTVYQRDAAGDVVAMKPATWPGWKTRAAAPC